MQVFLIRHADAVDESGTLPDSARHLSPVGRQQARDLGDRLRWHDCVPTEIWTSPLVRAVQTSELVIGGLASMLPALVHVELAPGGDLRRLMAELSARNAVSSIIIVGHEPSLSALGSMITNQRTFDPLRRAEAVRIDADRIRWRFAHDDPSPVAPKRLG